MDRDYSQKFQFEIRATGSINVAVDHERDVNTKLWELQKKNRDILQIQTIINQQSGNLYTTIFHRGASQISAASVPDSTIPCQ